jgi:hypothetical protein
MAGMWGMRLLRPKQASFLALQVRFARSTAPGPALAASFGRRQGALRSVPFARSAPQDAARTAAVLTDGVNAAASASPGGKVSGGAGELRCSVGTASGKRAKRTASGSEPFFRLRWEKW